MRLIVHLNFNVEPILYKVPSVNNVHVLYPAGFMCPQAHHRTSCILETDAVHWLPVAVDGTSRHEAPYIHCTLGGTSIRNQLSSWWLLGGSKETDTLYVASQEIHFDDELRKAATVSFKDIGGNDRQSLFFCVQTGKPTCSWEVAKTGRRSQGVLDLHAEPCPVPCCLLPCKCNAPRLLRCSSDRFYI